MRSHRPLSATVAALVLLAATALVPASSGAAPGQSSACEGVEVTATVRAGLLPGGQWGVDDVCVQPETVYEAGVLGVRVIGGIGVAEYREGHLGRIAFAMVELGEDRSATILGVEDVATDTVVWSFAEGSFAERDGVREVTGGGVAAPNSPDPVPTEPSSLELSIVGTGTDLASAEGDVPDLLRGFLDEATSALSD